MRKHPFPLAAALLLALACASQAAENPRSALARPNPEKNQARKVWTNDDVNELRARSPISIVGQEPGSGAASAQAPLSADENTFPVYDSRLDDPEWYAKVASELQAELDQREADLEQQQAAMAEVKDRITQAGVALNEPSPGVTPDETLAILQARVQEIQSQLDELNELAREHDIPPGDLRS